jgi:hypothetical protein
MIKAPYDQLIEKISKLAGLEKEEVIRRIEAKKAKLSGLISNEGAAQIVAAELGVSFEKQKLKISDLMIGMKKISVTGQVIEAPVIKTFKRQQQDAEVAFFMIADDTSNIRVVLWDTKDIDLIKNGTIKKDAVIDIKNADVRGTTVRDLHLNSSSDLSLSDAKFDSVVTTKEAPLFRKIKEIKANENASIRAYMLQMFNLSFFNVCPECNMKVNAEGDKFVCVRHGNVMPRKRAIMNMIIDDGSENMRAIAFNDMILKIFNLQDNSKLEDPMFITEKKEEMIGTEFFFTGRIKKNALFNRDEIIISSCEKTNPEMVIKQFSQEI